MLALAPAIEVPVDLCPNPHCTARKKRRGHRGPHAGSRMQSQWPFTDAVPPTPVSPQPRLVFLLEKHGLDHEFRPIRGANRPVCFFCPPEAHRYSVFLCGARRQRPLCAKCAVKFAWTLLKERKEEECDGDS